MKKDEIAIRSGVAGYLTDAATVGDRADSIEMRYEDENVWLTQKMLAALYDVSVAAINCEIQMQLQVENKTKQEIESTKEEQRHYPS